MRYADGPHVHCEIGIEAPLPRVWELVTDIGLPARLSPELRRVAWLGGADRPAVGARFEGHNRHAALGTWRTVSHVVELAEPRAFAWVVTDADGRFGDPVPDPSRPMASWRYDLRERGTGVLLRQSAVLGPGRSGVTLALERRPEREEEIIAFRLAELRTGMEATLLGVKALAEGREPTAGRTPPDAATG